MSKLLVYATAVFFIGYGVGFIIWPMEIANWVTDGAPSVPSAKIDLRATYGGAQLAIGVIMLIIVQHKQDIDLALVMVGLCLLLMALGRLVGIMTDGQANALMYVYLIAELVFGFGAFFLRKRHSDTQITASS
ncbi:DUF4345 domain-containing protein [Shewanella waksmanii]|uniref:DUF4345 domain-containing protein n=1 Tax=Shewanella waksmanii TaxID=213783 RepID=UPI0037355959